MINSNDIHIDKNGEHWTNFNRCRAKKTRVEQNTCTHCKQPFWELKNILTERRRRNPNVPICCSRKCAAIMRGRAHRKEKSPNWKGGRQKCSRSGYVTIVEHSHPFSRKGSKRIMEHRLIMEKYLGRYLFPEETVHHKNGIRDDNRIENLELWATVHPPGQRIEDLIKWAKEFLAKYDNK